MIGIQDLGLVCRRRIRLLDRCVIQPCLFGSLYAVIIHMLDLFIGKGNIQPSQTVNGSRHGAEIHGNIIFNIQVHIGIDDIRGISGSADEVCGIKFIIDSISFGIFIDSEISIPVYRHQADFFGIIVNAGNDSSIAVSVSAVFGSLVHAEKSNIRIAVKYLVV